MNFTSCVEHSGEHVLPLENHFAMGEGLAWKIGRLLRAERERARFTQGRLAARAGVPHQQVSRLESGQQNVTTAVVEKLFAALGRQLRLDVEPLDAELDAAIEDAGGRALDLQIMLAKLDWARRFGRSAPTMILDGALAACVLGVPITPERADVLVARSDLESLAEWLLCQINVRRHNERTRDFSNWNIDPREPGVTRYELYELDLSVTLVDEPPQAVIVRVDGIDWPVRPLNEILISHPEVARVARRADSLRA